MRLGNKAILLFNQYTVEVSFLARDREFFFGLNFHHDHFGICQEYTWGRYGTLTNETIIRL
jgi:hypothetical protein